MAGSRFSPLDLCNFSAIAATKPTIHSFIIIIIRRPVKYSANSFLRHRHLTTTAAAVQACNTPAFNIVAREVHFNNIHSFYWTLNPPTHHKDKQCIPLCAQSICCCIDHQPPPTAPVIAILNQSATISTRHALTHNDLVMSA